MGVISCDYRRGDWETRVDYRRRGFHRVPYLVITDGANMAPEAVANECLATGPNPGPETLPDVNDSYSHLGSSDPTSFAREHTIRALDDASNKRWHIDVSYAPMAPGETIAHLDLDPIARPVVWEADREVYVEEAEVDRNGVPIRNFAGLPFDVQIEIPKSRPVAIAHINVASIATVFSLMQTYTNAVNSTLWQGLQKRQALCRDVTSLPVQNEGGGSFYRVDFRFAIMEGNGKWDHRLSQRGFSHFKRFDGGQFVTNDGKPHLFRATNYAFLTVPDGAEDPYKEYGELLTEPLNLEEDGTARPFIFDAIVSDFEVYREADFNAIFPS